MDAPPHMGVPQYAPRNPVTALQQQQMQQEMQRQMQFQQDFQPNGQMLPPIPHLLPAGNTPSFQLTAASVPPAGIVKSATASTVSSGDDCYSLTQQLVTPTSPIFDCTTKNMPGQHQQPQSSPLQPHPQSQQHLPASQQPLQLLDIPIGHAYTYHPSTEHSQTTGLILNNNPITPTASRQHVLSTSASVQASTRPRPPRNKSKFKRFRNAFIFFVNDQRSKVDDETKRLKNREFLQLMSARWKGMPESERSPYVKLAEDDKRRFNDDVKKFGKYESRQRRYNKSRHTSKDVPGQSTPYTMPPGSSRYSSTTAGFLYNSGYAAMAAQPTQEQANAAAAAARFPAFYVGLPAGPQASVAATASWQPSVVPGMANSAVTVPVGMQQVQAQPNALLCPPGLLAQRTSLSSSGSSNEPNEIQQTSVSPRFPWMPAAARSPGGQMEAGKYNVYYQQQPPVGNYVQVPTGAPISHSLTEPVFYGDSRAQPHIAAAVQAQIQNSQVLAHQQQQQQQQQQRAFQAHNYHTLA